MPQPPEPPYPALREDCEKLAEILGQIDELQQDEKRLRQRILTAMDTAIDAGDLQVMPGQAPAVQVEGITFRVKRLKVWAYSDEVDRAKESIKAQREYLTYLKRTEESTGVAEHVETKSTVEIRRPITPKAKTP